MKVNTAQPHSAQAQQRGTQNLQLQTSDLPFRL